MTTVVGQRRDVGLGGQMLSRLRLRRRFWGRFNFSRRMEWQAVLRLLEPRPTDVVCDIGCGAGTYAHMMAAHAGEVHGIDVALDALRMATGVERPEGCLFECGVAQRLPYRDGAFDRAFSISTLEHLEQDVAAVREAGRVLKPQGRAVFTMDTWWSPGHDAGSNRDDVLESRHIQQLYRLPDAALMFDACGFQVDDAFYLLRSGLSQQLHQMGSRLGYSGSLLYVMLFPVLYALAIIADSGVPRDREGYILVIVASKRTT